jgi:lysophospholipase L1-like esterase
VKRSDIALAAAAVLAATGAGFALWPRPTPIVVADPAAVRIDRPAAAVVDRPTALIIGDSYTAGSGLAELSYGCQAATAMGWICKLAAEDGTGYISGGAANRFPRDQNAGMSTSFGERIPRLATAYDPDVVILDGGRNDQFAPPQARTEVMASAIKQARQTWPQARIVFVAPRFLNRPDDDLGVDGGTIDELREVSGVKDLVVVDPVVGFRGRDTAALVSRDGKNPTAAGERALASALSDALVRNGLKPAT